MSSSMSGDSVKREVTYYLADGKTLDLSVSPNPRPYTAAENAAADAYAAQAAAQAVQTQLTTDTSADLAKLRASIDALAVLLGDEATTNSLRAIIGASGATAGTGSLRALKAQTAANVVTAASIKALIDLVISLAQRTIDAAQADRRIARQTLRLARQMVGDFSTADVGSDT